MAKLNISSEVAARTSSQDSMSVSWNVKDIPLGEIKIKDNVRKEYSGIELMADSIREQGLINPITVYEDEDGYVIKAGHRRYMAYKILCVENPDLYHSMRCIISDSKNVLMVQMIENVQREGLTPLDLYQGLKALKDSGMTLKQIAVVLGKTEQYIKDLFMGINVIDTDNDYINLLGRAGTTIQNFRETAAIKDKEEKIQAITDIASGKIKRKDLRKIVKDKKPAKQKKRSDAKPPAFELHTDKDKLTVKLAFQDNKSLQLMVSEIKSAAGKHNLKMIKDLHP